MLAGDLRGEEVPGGLRPAATTVQNQGMACAVQRASGGLQQMPRFSCLHPILCCPAHPPHPLSHQPLDHLTVCPNRTARMLITSLRTAGLIM